MTRRGKDASSVEFLYQLRFRLLSRRHREAASAGAATVNGT
jgi:hypothetical protein